MDDKNLMPLKPMMAYNTGDVVQFMFFKKFGVKYQGGEEKTRMNYWNKCSGDFGNELMQASYHNTKQVKIQDTSERIFKIVVSKLTLPILSDFTKSYNITEDYLVLFTD